MMLKLKLKLLTMNLQSIFIQRKGKADQIILLIPDEVIAYNWFKPMSTWSLMNLLGTLIPQRPEGPKSIAKQAIKGQVNTGTCKTIIKQLIQDSLLERKRESEDSWTLMLEVKIRWNYTWNRERWARLQVKGNGARRWTDKE